MNEQITYITDLAKQYNTYTEEPDKLFEDLNLLPENSLSDIYKEYGDSERSFQPVVLLRAEVARRLLEGKVVTKETVEEIKEKIRTKDIDYFPHLSPEYLKQLQEKKLGKRDMFASWQRDWSVFHTFFYRDKVKETVQIYLEQIGKTLIHDLELSDYTIHWVDFYGANNFGQDSCWIALYPQNKASHKDAHQFFLKIKADNGEAGKVAGWNLEKREQDLRKAKTYEQYLEILRQLKPEILDLNKQIRSYFKFAPGRGAVEWERFYENKIIAVNYSNLSIEDISDINSLEELNEACGFEKNNNSTGGSWHLYLFKSAQIGDVVFASRGTTVCVGIGIIEGDYYYDENASDYKHRRKVNWITDKVYEYKAYTLKGYPKMFRADTFSPTLIWQFILSEYVRLYPELKEVFDKYEVVKF